MIHACERIRDFFLYGLRRRLRGDDLMNTSNSRRRSLNIFSEFPALYVDESPTVIETSASTLTWSGVNVADTWPRMMSDKTSQEKHATTAVFSWQLNS